MEELVRRPPRLEGVVVDLAEGDGAAQRLGGGVDGPLAPGDEQQPPGMRAQLARLCEQFAAGAVRQPLVAEDQSHPLAVLVHARELGERRCCGAGGHDPVGAAVAVLELAADELDDIGIVVHRQDHGQAFVPCVGVGRRVGHSSFSR